MISSYKKGRDPFVAYTRNDEKDQDAVQQFLNNGGKVTQLREPVKGFKEAPKTETGIFVFSREERLAAK